MDWQKIPKPAEIAESRLLEGILTGHFAINSCLPGERELAAQLGVTRPTLREAFQRLERDGWIEIQHGKPTRVRDYWQEGNLGVLAVLARSPRGQSPDFIVHLLGLRVLLAPEYARQAVEAAPGNIADLLEGYSRLEDTPAAYAQADWEIHRCLTQRAANPVFRLLLNSFRDLYILMCQKYFTYAECRQHSQRFYADLLACARKGAPEDAGKLTRSVMEGSLELWKKMQEEEV